MLALVGDTSDNVPGIDGVGPKTARKLLDKYKDIETILEHADEAGNKRVREGLKNGKDIVITLSKSGSIYFLKRDNGLPVLSIKEEIIDFGDFKYSYKKSIVPKSLSDSNYYNFLGKVCKNCSLNTKIFGPLPPILKLERISDGTEGGPQWPGASLDTLNNLLILASNHNMIYTTYIDFIPKPPSSLPQNSLIKDCTSCHDS